MHIRDYKNFSKVNPGYPLKDGYTLYYEELLTLIKCMDHISEDAENLNLRLNTDLSSSDSTSLNQSSSNMMFSQNAAKI